MAEQSGRFPLFRFRFPFRSNPTPPTPAPAPPRPLPTPQKQQLTPLPSQPPSASPLKILVQQEVPQSQPSPALVSANELSSQSQPSAALVSANELSSQSQPSLVSANESSSVSSYKDFAGDSNDLVQEKPITEIISKSEINSSTNQELPQNKNNSPAKKLPEEIEVTKEVMNVEGKHIESDKEHHKEEKNENKTDVKVLPISTPAENSKIQENQSKQAGVEEEQSNTISAHPREFFGEGNEYQRATNLDIPNASQQQNRSSDTTKQPSLNLITLAGENNGATMNISTSEKQAKEQTKGTESNNLQSNKRKSADMEMISGTFANSNSQSINNSILHNTSCSEKSPGVHFEFFKGLPAQFERSLDQKHETFDHVLHQQTPQTRIRRRCLQSLFMDTDSDIENENVHRPRRHGCRYNCKASKTNLSK